MRGYAFFASSLVSNLWQTLGDTLQTSFALFLLVAALSRRFIRSSMATMLLCLVALFLCFFVHEASIFFLAPCLPFVVRRNPTWKEALVSLVALASLLALSLRWSDLHVHLRYSPLVFRHTSLLMTSVQTPGFARLLQQEWQNDFATAGAVGWFALRLGKLALLTLAGLVALANCCAQRSLRILAATMPCLLGLLVVAHDWGRFLSYAFLLAITISGLPASDEVYQTARRSASSTGWLNHFTHLAKRTEVQAFALAMLFLSPNRTSRLFGMSSEALACGAGMLLIFALPRLLSITPPAPAVSEAFITEPSIP